MPELLILVSISIPVVVIIVFPGLTVHFRLARLINRFKFSHLISRLKFPGSHKAESNPTAATSEQPDMSVLNCRVRQRRQEDGDNISDTLVVEICGSIYTPGDGHYAVVRISITDITDQNTAPKPVHSSTKQWQTKDSPVLCYSADIGRMPEKVVKLSDWIVVARLSSDWLMPPCKGKRYLRIAISILSRNSSEELACARCNFTYKNPNFGYLDLQENIQRTKTLSVALAFAVSTADSKLFDCEIELIKKWARDNLEHSQVSGKAWRKLEKALNKTVAFFRHGNRIDVYEICREIAEIAPIAERYDILELCLRVTAANGSAAAEELAVLKDLAAWLGVDTDRFRDMMGKILPADMHKVQDVEVLLGVTSDMTKEQTKEHLSKEYRKWNARATNSDPQIQSQADHMLSFIAEARSQCIG